MQDSGKRGAMPWRRAGLVFLWVLTGCVTSPGKTPSFGGIPGGFKYRPTTPQDAPDTAKARKQAQQARDAREGTRTSAPRDSGVAAGPPLLLAESDAEGAALSPTGEDALPPISSSSTTTKRGSSALTSRRRRSRTRSGRSASCTSGHCTSARRSCGNSSIGLSCVGPRRRKSVCGWWHLATC